MLAESRVDLFVDRVLAVWDALPEPMAGVRLAQLAASVFGNAHALDYREDLGRAVARLLAHVHGLPKPTRPDRHWRAAWAAAGVRCDGVSSRVLTLNLPLTGEAPATRWCGPTGEPVWLTLRSITGNWSVSPSTPVFVCENVSVVEAAAHEYGPNCPPTVCTDGNSSLAAIDLVVGLATAGCALSVRADIDDAGLVIVENLMAAAPDATLWHYGVPTYRRYLGIGGLEASAGDPRRVSPKSRRCLDMDGGRRRPLCDERP
ncbi:TIGR02679 domain-containing protein [Nocardia pseudovaccinii]|uniref:TIGR02679 domain-containing protein n=1 Tax=Nocardia pseudovaccinii TaxID=189540 RepID=UPI003D8EC75B